MLLHFDRIQSGSNRYLPLLMPLYADSFPLEERRLPNDLLWMLNEPKMYFSAVLGEDQVEGLVVYWKFPGFLYLEHLAVLPARRRNGIGAGILDQLLKEGVPLLLEVEIPFDESSTKRVDFYHRCGFCALPVYYHQPPYRKGESVVPMMLFSNKSDWDEEVLGKSVALFQRTVYYSEDKGR